MTPDAIMTLSVVGTLLLLNIISWILVWTTAIGKDWIYSTMKTESKAYFIFWNIWMIFTGVCYWVCVGFEVLRYGKRDHSAFKDITPKQIMQMLEEEWAKRK